MEAWNAFLKEVNDDYLIGLSNKGTLKRAYKDMEKETPVLTWQGEEARVALQEETCVLRMPLGESSCSCPSQSMCRHIVTAVLWLKGQEGASGIKSIKSIAGEDDGKKAETKRSAPEEGQSGMTAVSMAQELEQELLSLPVERLKNACGSSRFERFLAHIHAEGLPPITEGSVVTVELLWEKATVKLLKPFAYSACTCRSKELCSHKAQAVLAYRLKKGKLALEALDAMRDEGNRWDESIVEEACAAVCEALCLQLCIGLSRQSAEVADELERLAVVAHRAALPALESGLREAASCYAQYFARSAAFRSGELFGILLGLYKRAKGLGGAKSQEQFRTLAGTFRDSYEPVGRLNLVGMGARTFSSKTGYEGEIYYFLEPQKREWYTWTDARPVFYEDVHRRPPAAVRDMAAPWGLDCSREQLQGLEIVLQNAKAASGGRLSASGETKGEIAGFGNLYREEISRMVVEDYDKLLSYCFSPSDGERLSGRREILALAGAARWDETCFDTVRQRFSWCVYDRQGRRLYISFDYTKKEQLTVRLLERLEQRLRKRQPERLVFFGSLYIDEEGRLCLYPIEFFSGNEAAARAPEEAAAFRQEGVPEEPAWEEPCEAVLDVMEQYCKEAENRLTDLFFCGLYSVQEETAKQLLAFAEEGERLGLHQAAKDFAYLGRFFGEMRHQMEFSPEPAVEALERLAAYFSACRRKLSYDRAALALKAAQEAAQ